MPSAPHPSSRPRRGSYGFDAPYGLAAPLAFIAANLASAALTGRAGPVVGAAAITALAGLGLHASVRGKFVAWDRILDELSLRGDEYVLDVGCGRGAVLVAAAKRLDTGSAVGVDVWRRRDQSGNAPAATLRNASAEGVADRVQVVTADMTALPFADGSFDVVLSSLAIHNVPGAARRDRAIDEAVRVLRPGGRLVIADLARTGRYCDRLRELGMGNIGRRSLGWRMWWTGPWMATRLVTATRPPRLSV